MKLKDTGLTREQLMEELAAATEIAIELSEQ